MTQLLWRRVSVWLCVAVLFCRNLSCHAGSTEPHPEAQKHVPSQEIESKDELEDKSPNEKNEENYGLPDQLSSENGDFHHSGEQVTQQAENAEVLESDGSTADAEIKDDGRISQPERSSEHQRPETSGSQELESEPAPPSTDSLAVVSAPYKDDPGINDVQEDIQSRDGSEAAAAESADFDSLPTDCAEEENNPYDDESSLPIVLENTSNAHTTGTKTEVVPPLTPPAVHSSKHLEANASLKEQDPSSPISADPDSTAGGKDPEDIPTFDEWKRKMMEVEKEKTALSTHTSNNGGSHTVKKVQKNFNNYASVECGAKILGANPEAKSTSAILKENMDLYMLNPCSTKIWFIIELCEPIQLKQLDIANFELFSSTPRDFLVSISDRYPTNKWLKLGTFHARDERTVQSFPLDEHLYAKYVKVELVSHFGSEHFCPLSLIRVFGTSMVEEYEEIADPSERADDQDDDLDYPPGSAPGEDKSKNLIGSAKDAIFNMVKDFAVVLGGNQEMTGNLSSQDVNLTEPSQQPETTTETITTDLSSVPEAEDLQGLPDSEVPPAVQDTSTTDNCEDKLPPVEEQIVIPLEKDEEEPISSTIILLGKEEELEDAKEKKDDQGWHRGNLKYCALCSSSCSCATSFPEFLRQQCSALSNRKTCQTGDKVQNIPSPLTPSLSPAPPSSTYPEPQPHDSKTDRSNDNEPATEPQSDRDTVEEEAVVPSGSVSESSLLEPSQTLNVPKPTATESPPAKPTPVVETPQLSSEEPPRESAPEKSQDASREEKLPEPSQSLSSAVEMNLSVAADDTAAAPTEDKPNVDPTPVETNTSVRTQEKLDQAPVPSSSPLENQAEPPAGAESVPSSSKVPPTTADPIPEPDPSGSPVTDAKTENLEEGFTVSSGGQDQMFRPSVPTPAAPTSTSLLDIYAEPFNGTEQNGNQVHGSSQKESVFMRLNNRIKALEVNMSLSGRYLEQLSQRYRKQMEEMQRAFNKTIIKLQNTSRIAEEQDLRQTESIHLLQGQLENVTQLVLNLSVRVSQLQSDVSDRQSYLLLSLMLCLCLGLLLCVNHFRIALPPATDPEPPTTKSPPRRDPERQFSSCDETGLKRSASYPLINSDTCQLVNNEGPEMLHAEENNSLCTANSKRRRRKLRPPDEVETLKPCFQSAPELCSGAAGRSSGPRATNSAPLLKQLLQPTFGDSPSEGSSEGSSHSDDPSFCGITAACPRICDGLPPGRTRAEKRALRRRRLKPSCAVVDLLHVPRRDSNDPLPVTLQDYMKRKTEHSSGPFVAIPGPV